MAKTADGDDGGRVVACRLKQLMHTDNSLAVIEEAVQRVHRVVIYASEAIALLVHEDVEAGVALDALLPIGEHGIADAMFRAVVSGRQGSVADSPHRAAQERVLEAFHRIHGTGATLVDGTGLGQLLKFESRFWITTLKTGICVHYRNRVKRYCQLRLRLPDAEYDALSKEGKKAHTRRVLCVTTDVCRPGWQQRVADAGDAAFVDATRSMLRLDDMAWAPTNRQNRPMKKTLTDLIKANPQHFLPGLAALSRAFAEAGGRTFRLVPMRTNLMPKFVNIDQQVVKELGLMDDDKRKGLNRQASKRCKVQKPFREALKALTVRNKTEKAEWRQADLDRNAALRKGQKKHKPPAEELARRRAREEAMATELAALSNDPAYLKLLAGASAEKCGAMDEVFDTNNVLSKKNAADSARSLKTDGVSARLLLKDGKEKGEDVVAAGSNKRDRAGRRPLPRRGLLSVDELRGRLLGNAAETLPIATVAELDGLAPREQNEVLNGQLAATCGGSLPFRVVGLDPGKHELAVLSDPDFEPARRREARAEGLVPRRLRYTLPQRRQAMRPASFFVKAKHAADPEKQRRAAAAKAYHHAHVHVPQPVLDAERALAGENASGPTATRLLAYLRARAALLPALLPYRTDPMRRQLHWKAFIEKQRSFSHVCDGIRQTFGGMRQPGEVERQVVLAYGTWALSTAKPSKGMPSCIGKGLLKKLSRQFVVVTVPEHYTSKRCFHCNSECGNHAYLAERDRRMQSDARLEQRFGERLGHAETAAQRAAAKACFDRALSRPCEIRGLRFCSGCKRCLNRDANSAPQMAVQLKRLVLGAGPLHKVSKEDAELQEMSNAIEG